MTSDQISLFAGVLLSLLFSYLPGLSGWFAAKDSTAKRLIMAGALLVVAVAVFGGACGKLLAALPLNVTCDQAGAVAIATNFVLALVANQSAYLITPQPTPALNLEPPHRK